MRFRATMILLDPDLDLQLHLSAASGSAAAKRRSGSNPPLASPANRLPSVRVLARFLNEARAAVRLRGQVSVLLTTDEAIQKLNRRFRGKNKPTDVLSFPAAPGPENLAGDLAISLPIAQRQADEHGHAVGVEIQVLILHGLLHLAGYDHEADHGEMARRERRLRARLGLPLGLIERMVAQTAARGAIRGRSHDRERRDERHMRKAIAGPSTRSLRSLAQDDNGNFSAKKSVAKKPVAKKSIANQPSKKMTRRKKSGANRSNRGSRQRRRP